MNWTGGRLQRHSGKSSRSRGALTNRQKEHFAKVKANLRSGGQRNSPTKWSIFDKIPVARSQRQSVENHATSWRHYEHNSKRERDRSEVEQERWNEREEYVQSPISDSFRGKPQAKCTNTRSSSVELAQRSPIPDDDLYNATPPPLRVKRERAASPELGDFPPNYDKRESKEESIEEKRRKILSQRDWVGLRIRRLPQLRFNPPKHDGDIGRRRKVKDGHRARYSKLQTRISSPFAARKVQMLDQEEEYLRRRAKSDVRISIGGRVVPPGISSSSRPNKIIHQSTPRMMHRTISSDEMLLDDENIMDDRDNLNSDRFLSAFESRTHGSGGHRSSMISMPSNGDMNASHTYKHQQRPEVAKHSPFLIINKGGDPHELGSKASTFSRTAAESVCEMKQPMPRRLARHSVLHLSSPKCNSSVLAQVGGLKRVVPENQLMNNDEWKAWIEPSAQGYSEDRRVSISPGISAVPTSRDDTCSRLGFDDENSGGKYEHDDSWEGCESLMIQESIEPSGGNISQPGKVNCITHNDLPYSSDSYDQPLSSEYCEVLDKIGVPIVSDQSTNEDDISIEPQYSHSSQRTSSSVPWDSPRSPSFDTIEPSQRNFIESPPSKTSPLQHQQKSSVARKTVKPEETTLMHNPVILSKCDQTSDRIKDCPAKSVHKETDQNELWMKFVFDENSEDEGVVSKKTTSTRIGPAINRRKPLRDANADVAAGSLPAILEKGNEGSSPTFSTFVHNSIDSQSPLQPRYVAPTRSRSMWQNPRLRENGTTEDEIKKSSGFSRYSQELNENYSPMMSPARARCTPHKENPYQGNRDSAVKNHASVVYPINSNIVKPSSSSSSEPESVSMIAVPGSQVDVSESTQSRSFLGTQRKIIFTKPQPFVGLRANPQSLSPDRTIHIGGGGTKKQTSEDYGLTLAEDIEDD